MHRKYPHESDKRRERGKGEVRERGRNRTRERETEREKERDICGDGGIRYNHCIQEAFRQKQIGKA